MPMTWMTSPLSPWQTGSGALADVVVDSRIRLVRNLKQVVFPARASDEELAAVCQAGISRLPALNMLGRGDYTYISLSDIDAREREVLAARHIASAALIAKPKQRALLVRDDGAAAIMINEADHFCIQTAASGLDLDSIWADVSQIDDTLESQLNMAFHDEFGYLTSSPFLTGTGLIAGVTLHLPALVAMKRLHRIIQGITKFGFTVCGVYGDRSEPIGNVFQITNQVTLGITEHDLLEQLDKMVRQVVQEERNCRRLLWQHHEDALKDTFHRAEGLLLHAYLMTEEEALRLAGDLRFAVSQGEAPYTLQAYDALTTVSTTAFLQFCQGKELTDIELNRQRAAMIQQVLAAHVKSEYARK